MGELMTGYTFAAELKGLGVLVPDNTVQIKILLSSYGVPVEVFYTVLDFSNGYNAETISENIVKGELPTGMTSDEFYNKLCTYVKLPDHTSKITIVAGVSEIVMMHIEAALPQNSLKFIKAV